MTVPKFRGCNLRHHLFHARFGQGQERHHDPTHGSPGHALGRQTLDFGGGGHVPTAAPTNSSSTVSDS